MPCLELKSKLLQAINTCMKTKGRPTFDNHFDLTKAAAKWLMVNSTVRAALSSSLQLGPLTLLMHKNTVYEDRIKTAKGLPIFTSIR